ncbi:MAG: flagellar basal body rod protein FlgC [Gammaproteobacteria bacterium]|nr:flagellar basal body rod protein FlgC [Gammaproteobacteria bacterium]
MSLFNIFDISGSGLSAQSVRLNVTASNISNAQSVAGSADAAYKARNPVFSAMYKDVFNSQSSNIGVQTLGIVENNTEAPKRYEPGNPLADDEGYIYLSNVNPIEEMTNMMSASRGYQNNVEVMNTSKDLLLQTLRLGE